VEYLRDAGERHALATTVTDLAISPSGSLRRPERRRGRPGLGRRPLWWSGSLAFFVWWSVDLFLVDCCGECHPLGWAAGQYRSGGIFAVAQGASTVVEFGEFDTLDFVCRVCRLSPCACCRLMHYVSFLSLDSLQDHGEALFLVESLGLELVVDARQLAYGVAVVH
jgi:hypothetical protein